MLTKLTFQLQLKFFFVSPNYYLFFLCIALFTNVTMSDFCILMFLGLWHSFNNASLIIKLQIKYHPHSHHGYAIKVFFPQHSTIEATLAPFGHDSLQYQTLWHGRVKTLLTILSASSVAFLTTILCNFKKHFTLRLFESC